MYMAVDMISGAVLIQKGSQGWKAPVGHVLAVTQTFRRGMGHQNVDAPGFADGPAHFENAAPHLPVGVLEGTRVIFSAAPQAQNAHAVVFHYMAVDAVAALRGIGLVAGVVVSMDIEHRTPGHGNEKTQIAGLQISAGNDQLVIRKPAGDIIVPEGGALLIGDKQDLHCRQPSFF